MNQPKYHPGQRVVANRHSVQVLQGQVGTVHYCSPTWDIQGPGIQRYAGWWYHVVFDNPVLHVPEHAWLCAEFTIDPIDDGKGDWDVIEKLLGWNPTKEKVH